MIKRFSTPCINIILLLVMVFSTISAEGSANGIMEVSQQQNTYTVEHYFQYYIDSTCIAGIKDIVVQGNKGCFKSWNPDKGLFNTGFTSANIWLKLTIVNQDSETGTFIWGLERDIDTAYLYEADTDQGTLEVQGPKSFMQPLGYRNPKVRMVAFEIKLASHQSKTLYLQIINRNDILEVPMEFYVSKYFLEKESNLSIIYGAFLGLLLLISFINLLFFIAIRERIFLWYGAYVFAALFLILTDRYFEVVLLPDWLATLLNRMGRLSIVLLALSFQLGMALELLEIKRSSERLYKISLIVLYGLVAFSIITVILNNMRYTASIGLLSAMFFVGFFWMIFMLMDLMAIIGDQMLKKNRTAFFYLVSYIPLFIASFNRLLAIFNMDFLGQLKLFALPLGLLFEILVLGLIVIYRFYRIYHERISLFDEKQLMQLKFAGDIITAQESERNRIAQDIHDELGATIGSLKYKIASHPLYNTESHTWDEIENAVNMTSQNLRNISHNLTNGNIESKEFSEVLKILVLEMTGDSKIKFNLILEGNIEEIVLSLRIAIYRIISECINNIMKHSNASEAEIQLVMNGAIILIIEDNGVGFNRQETSLGMGLKNIEARLNYLKGKIQIDTSFKGTSIIIEIPLL